MSKRLIIILAVAAACLLGDQATKYAARASLQGEPAVVLVPGYLDLEYHENPGATFGLLRGFSGARYLFIAFGLLAPLIMWPLVRQVGPQQKLADIAYAMVAGGALGNVVDRITIGRVVDFILMHWHRRYIWPAYNIADAVLVVGVGLMLLAISQAPAPPPAAKSGRRRGRRETG